MVARVSGKLVATPNGEGRAASGLDRDSLRSGDSQSVERRVRSLLRIRSDESVLRERIRMGFYDSGERLRAVGSLEATFASRTSISERDCFDDVDVVKRLICLGWPNSEAAYLADGRNFSRSLTLYGVGGLSGRDLHRVTQTMMVYAAKVATAMVISAVASVVALLFQPTATAGLSNAWILILSPLLGGVGVIVVAILQNRRARQKEAVDNAAKSHDTEVKASGIDADERKDARAVLLQIIAQQNVAIQNHADALQEQAVAARTDREELTKSYCAQIAGLQSSINLLREEVSTYKGLALSVEQMTALLADAKKPA